MHGDFIVDDVKQQSVVAHAEPIANASNQGFNIALGRRLCQLLQRLYYTSF